MQVLEENYLRSIMQLDFITKKITNRYTQLGISNEEFARIHPAYIDLNMSFYHLAIFQARKLYEAELGDGLSDEEWLKLKSFREHVTHARDPQSKEIRKIGDLNEELIPLLNKLSHVIHKKYNLDVNDEYQEFVEVYFEDLNNL